MFLDTCLVITIFVRLILYVTVAVAAYNILLFFFKYDAASIT